MSRLYVGWMRGTLICDNFLFLFPTSPTRQMTYKWYSTRKPIYLFFLWIPYIQPKFEWKLIGIYNWQGIRVPMCTWPYVAILLDSAPIFEWHTVRGVVKNKHPRKLMLRWDWTVCSKRSPGGHTLHWKHEGCAWITKKLNPLYTRSLYAKTNVYILMVS